MGRPPPTSRTNRTRSSTAAARHEDRSGGAAPPSRKSIPEKPTISASFAASVSSRLPLPPIRIGGRGFCTGRYSSLCPVTR
ncbi:MAG TPA: hypothetical protein VFW46_05340, partial [Stellaceae bacterium]|nr:hypothetical protein [Stellaceae bacterium]